MIQQKESEIDTLHRELNEFKSMKSRNIITQKELDIVAFAINEEIYDLCKNYYLN